jgi:hypothetical protein
MRDIDFLRLVLVVLLAVLINGCGKRDKVVAPPSSDSGTTTPAASGGGVKAAKQYHPSLRKEQVDRVMSEETETEAQVIAILGEPTERSETRRFNNRLGTFEEYDLTWLKAEGQPAVRVTFLNGKKKEVISTVK